MGSHNYFSCERALQAAANLQSMWYYEVYVKLTVLLSCCHAVVLVSRVASLVCLSIRLSVPCGLLTQKQKKQKRSSDVKNLQKMMRASRVIFYDQHASTWGSHGTQMRWTLNRRPHTRRHMAWRHLYFFVHGVL